MWTYNYSYDYTDEDLMHYGVLGMKWGVRRQDNKERRSRSRAENKYTKQGNKLKSKGYASSLSRQISKTDDVQARKRRIDADIKEADERVKYYGSKRAAKAAIKDEAGYAKSVNRGKAAVNTLKYGTIAAVPVSILASLATGGIAGVAAVGAAASYGVTGAIMGTGAAAANRYINKHAKEQISYTDESEYGHDFVVTMKKR